MRYTKKERDSAALICAIAASRPDRWRAFYDQIQDDIGAEDSALFLAQDAWSVAHMAHFGRAGVWEWPPEVDAEAEALIRTGWEPES